MTLPGRRADRPMARPPTTDERSFAEEVRVSLLASPIGIHDFAELRRRQATYVDKTAFVTDLLHRPTPVTQFLRPRRFGKTLFVSTLRHFLGRGGEDRADLFQGLAVWDDAKARRHFGRHPVIDLTFEGIHQRTWRDAFTSIRRVLTRLCQQHAYLLDDPRLSHPTRRRLERVLALEADPAEYRDLLGWLSRALADHDGAPAVILIDEYDTPLHAAYAHGYDEEALSFFRVFLGNGLKDNNSLFRGVLTGTLRVAELADDINNVTVDTPLTRRYATAFGFTEPEMTDLARLAGAEERLDAIRDWYDGYRFGGETIYNSWSVLNFLSDPAQPPQPFWRLTGSDGILRRLLLRRGLAPTDWEALLAGETVDKPLFESLSLRDLDRSVEPVWTFLLFSGYVTATAVDYERAEPRARLRIPNREVRGVYESIFAGWLRDALDSDTEVEALLRALLRGDADVVGRYLTRILTDQASYHDFPRRAGEAIYHAFVLGLLVRLAGDYHVRSNRESGYGRADVLIIPKRPGHPGVVLELKALEEDETVDTALASAVTQLTDRDYAAELRAAGATPVHALAVVFDGKRAHVRPAPT